LFDLDYPAPGDPALARLICETVANVPIILDSDWGLDHGAWSVLCRMFPLADIPVTVREDSTVPFRNYCMYASQ
jgi:4,5-DOPA dioxygenase extradiol